MDVRVDMCIDTIVNVEINILNILKQNLNDGEVTKLLFERDHCDAFDLLNNNINFEC